MDLAVPEVPVSIPFSQTVRVRDRVRVRVRVFRDRVKIKRTSILVYWYLSCVETQPVSLCCTSLWRWW
jgi:hypothetical protein